MVAESRVYLYVGEKSKKYYTILLKVLKKEGHLCLVSPVGISEETKQFLYINGYHCDLIMEREDGWQDWVIFPFGVVARQFFKNPDTRYIFWTPLRNQGKETINYIQSLRDSLNEDNGVIDEIPVRLVVINSSDLYT